MKMRNRILLMVLLVFSVILSMVPVTNATTHEHDYQFTMRDFQFHTMVCNTCGETRTVTHSFKNTQTCVVCGYTQHECTWQFNGDIYSDNHGMKCTQCDSTTIEHCTLGSDGNCIVCGQPPAHWHDFYWKGRQYSERAHLLECDCGETNPEDHLLAWDGVNRSHISHGVVCVVCGETRIHGHWYSYVYKNGKVCVQCGYELEEHTWKYNNSCDNELHQLICSTCSQTKFEAHQPDNKGNCSVCGYHVYDVTEPIETEPVETEPVETEPIETEPAESAPADTQPTESNPPETEPTETTPDKTVPTEPNPAETLPDETKTTETPPVETTATETIPAPLDTNPEPPAKNDVQRRGAPWIWVCAIILVLGALGAAFIIRKKKVF